MGAFQVFGVECLVHARTMKARMLRNPKGTVWFVALLIATAWFGLVLADIVAASTEEFLVKPSTLLLFAFLVFTGKSVVETQHRLVENRESVYQLVAISPGRVALGKFLWVLFSNLGLLALAYLAVTYVYILTLWSGHPLTFGGHGIPPLYLVELIMLTAAASSQGFVYGFITTLPLKRRAAAIVLYSQIPGVFGAYMKDADPLGGNAPLIVLCFTLLSISTVPLVFPMVLEAWNTGTAGKRTMFIQRRIWSGWSWLERLLSRKTAWIVRKEVVVNIQRKEIAGNMMAVVGTAALLIWTWRWIEDSWEVPVVFRDLAYPVIICTGIYLSGVLQAGLIGLGTLGKEGKSIWIFKTLPVSGYSVFRAKAVSILLFTPVSVVLIALPLPVLLGFGAHWVLFYAVSLVSVTVLFTGIGLYLGSLYPEFVGESGGTPDIVSMYTLMMTCLILSALELGSAGFAMARHIVYGAEVSGIWFCVNTIILLGLLEKASERYDRMEVS